jgi:uncharacterized membrane protein YgcG
MPWVLARHIRSNVPHREARNRGAAQVMRGIKYGWSSISLLLLFLLRALAYTQFVKPLRQKHQYSPSSELFNRKNLLFEMTMTMYPGPGETSAASRRSAAAGTSPWQPPVLLFAPPRGGGGGSNGGGSSGGSNGSGTNTDTSKSHPVLAVSRWC